MSPSPYLACDGLPVFLSAGWRGTLYETIWKARPRSSPNSDWLKAGVLSDPVALFAGVNMKPFQAECGNPEPLEAPTHLPSGVILAQAQHGGCSIGPRDTYSCERLPVCMRNSLKSLC